MARAREFILQHKKFFTGVVIAVGVLASVVILVFFVLHGFSLFTAQDYETNIYTELFGVFLSVFISVVIVGGWTEIRARQQLRARLKREAGSRSNDIAISAVEWLREKKWLVGEKGLLKDADLSNVNLQRADLSKANLHGARLNSANLREATLDKAELIDAHLSDADLQDVRSWYANLQGAMLWHVKLQRALLGAANLQQAELDFAQLEKTQLPAANIQGASLFLANLQGADLRNANLQEAELTKANLSEADLLRADLQKAKLKDVDLANSCFNGCRFAKYKLVGSQSTSGEHARRSFTRSDLGGCEPS